MFKTETHLHTSEGSACGKIGAAEMIRLYHEAGYKTVFVSDHLKGDYFERMGKDLSWEERCDIFYGAFEKAKEEGDKLGVNVIFSAELTLDTCPNHYLLYGIDKSFIVERPDIFSLSLSEFYEYATSKNVMIVQAHPYRDGRNYPTPEIVDAIEAYNSNPRHNDYEDKAFVLAEEHGKPTVAGSDAHRYEDVAGAAVLTESEIKTAEDYIALVKSRAVKIAKGREE